MWQALLSSGAKVALSKGTQTCLQPACPPAPGTDLDKRAHRAAGHAAGWGGATGNKLMACAVSVQLNFQDQNMGTDFPSVFCQQENPLLGGV